MRPFRFVGDAEEVKRSRHAAGKLRKVFADHNADILRDDLIGSEDFHARFPNHFGDLRVVIQQRVAALEFEFVRAAIRLAHAVDHLGETVSHLLVVVVQTADRPFEHAGIRNDDVVLTALELADGDRRGMQRVVFQRVVRLEGLPHVHAAVDGVDAGMRRSAVTALTGNRQLKVIARCHDGTRDDADGARRQIGPQVHPQDDIRLRIIQCTGLDHVFGSCIFFVGLEQKYDRPRDFVAVGREDFGDDEHHGHVTVVSARVHEAGVFRSERQAGHLLDRQRVDI